MAPAGYRWGLLPPLPSGAPVRHGPPSRPAITMCMESSADRRTAETYRRNAALRAELTDRLVPLLAAARPLGWKDLAELTGLPHSSVARLARRADADSIPPLNLATMLRLAHTGRRLARLVGEQEVLRAHLWATVADLRGEGWSWRKIANHLGGDHDEDVTWVRNLARSSRATGASHPRQPKSDLDRLAIALGRDTTTQTLLRAAAATGQLPAQLPARLERYVPLGRERIERIVGVAVP